MLAVATALAWHLERIGVSAAESLDRYHRCPDHVVSNVEPWSSASRRDASSTLDRTRGTP
jgi:hypothetical protein